MLPTTGGSGHNLTQEQQNALAYLLATRQRTGALALPATQDEQHSMMGLMNAYNLLQFQPQQAAAAQLHMLQYTGLQRAASSFQTSRMTGTSQMQMFGQQRPNLGMNIVSPSQQSGNDDVVTPHTATSTHMSGQSPDNPVPEVTKQSILDMIARFDPSPADANELFYAIYEQCKRKGIEKIIKFNWMDELAKEGYLFQRCNPGTQQINKTREEATSPLPQVEHTSKGINTIHELTANNESQTEIDTSLLNAFNPQEAETERPFGIKELVQKMKAEMAMGLWDIFPARKAKTKRPRKLEESIQSKEGAEMAMGLLDTERPLNLEEFIQSKEGAEIGMSLLNAFPPQEVQTKRPLGVKEFVQSMEAEMAMGLLDAFPPQEAQTERPLNLEEYIQSKEGAEIGMSLWNAFPPQEAQTKRPLGVKEFVQSMEAEMVMGLLDVFPPRKAKTKRPRKLEESIQSKEGAEMAMGLLDVFPPQEAETERPLNLEEYIQSKEGAEMAMGLLDDAKTADTGSRKEASNSNLANVYILADSISTDAQNKAPNGGLLKCNRAEVKKGQLATSNSISTPAEQEPIIEVELSEEDRLIREAGWVRRSTRIPIKRGQPDVVPTPTKKIKIDDLDDSVKKSRQTKRPSPGTVQKKLAKIKSAPGSWQRFKIVPKAGIEDEYRVRRNEYLAQRQGPHHHWKHSMVQMQHYVKMGPNSCLYEISGKSVPHSGKTIPDELNYKNLFLGQFVWGLFKNDFWPGWVNEIKVDKKKVKVTINFFGADQEYTCDYEHVDPFDVAFAQRFVHKDEPISREIYCYYVAETISVIGKIGYYEEFLGRNCFNYIIKFAEYCKMLSHVPDRLLKAWIEYAPELLDVKSEDVYEESQDPFKEAANLVTQISKKNEDNSTESTFVEVIGFKQYLEKMDHKLISREIEAPAWPEMFENSSIATKHLMLEYWLKTVKDYPDFPLHSCFGGSELFDVQAKIEHAEECRQSLLGMIRDKPKDNTSVTMSYYMGYIDELASEEHLKTLRPCNERRQNGTTVAIIKEETEPTTSSS